MYTFTDLGIWSTVEIGVALTASNLATLKPLMRKLRLFNSTSGISRYGSRSQQLGPGANTVSGRHTSGRVKSYVNGNNHITITGPAAVRESRGSRWNRKESMELELVHKNDGTSVGSTNSREEQNVEKDDYHSRDKPSWLNV